MGRTIHGKRTKGGSTAKLTNNCCIFGIMGGTAPLTGKPLAHRAYLEKRASRKALCITDCAQGHQYLKDNHILGCNPQAGGVGNMWRHRHYSHRHGPTPEGDGSAHGKNILAGNLNETEICNNCNLCYNIDTNFCLPYQYELNGFCPKRSVSCSPISLNIGDVPNLLVVMFNSINIPDKYSGVYRLANPINNIPYWVNNNYAIFLCGAIENGCTNDINYPKLYNSNLEENTGYWIICRSNGISNEYLRSNNIELSSSSCKDAYAYYSPPVYNKTQVAFETWYYCKSSKIKQELSLSNLYIYPIMNFNETRNVPNISIDVDNDNENLNDLRIKVEYFTQYNGYKNYTMKVYRTKDDCDNQKNPVRFLIDSANQQLNIPNNWNDNITNSNIQTINLDEDIKKWLKATWGYPANFVTITDFWVKDANDNSINLANNTYLHKGIENTGLSATLSQTSESPPFPFQDNDGNLEQGGNFGLATPMHIYNQKCGNTYIIGSVPTQLRYKYVIQNFDKKSDDIHLCFTNNESLLSDYTIFKPIVNDDIWSSAPKFYTDILTKYPITNNSYNIELISNTLSINSNISYMDSGGDFKSLLAKNLAIPSFACTRMLDGKYDGHIIYGPLNVTLTDRNDNQYEYIVDNNNNTDDCNPEKEETLWFNKPGWTDPKINLGQSIYNTSIIAYKYWDGISTTLPYLTFTLNNSVDSFDYNIKVYNGGTFAHSPVYIKSIS